MSSAACVGVVWRSTFGAGHAAGSAGRRERETERERLRAVPPTWTSLATGPATTVKAPHDTGGGSSGLQQLLTRPPPGTNTLVPTAGYATKYLSSSLLAHSVLVLLVLLVLDNQTLFCRGQKDVPDLFLIN